MEYATPATPFTEMPKLTFSQKHPGLELREGTELLRVPFLDASAPLKFGCCKGMCGTCAIKIAKGAENLSPPTKEEQATLSRLHLESHRLACQCALLGDVAIDC